jgi:hypothetical protein
VTATLSFALRTVKQAQKTVIIRRRPFFISSRTIAPVCQLTAAAQRKAAGFSSSRSGENPRGRLAKLQVIKPAAERSLGCYFFADFLAFFFFAMESILEVRVSHSGRVGLPASPWPNAPAVLAPWHKRLFVARGKLEKTLIFP